MQIHTTQLVTLVRKQNPVYPTSKVLHLHNKTALKQTELLQMSRGMRFPTLWYVRPAKPQISLRSLIRAFASRLNII